MKKQFLTLAMFMATKAITQEAFDVLGADEQAKIFNELNENNAQAIKEMEEAKVSKEDLQKAIETLNADRLEQMKTLNKALEEIGLQMKSQREKGGFDPNAEKSELLKFIERDKSARGEGKGMEAVTVKAAALMTTANVVPNVASGFNQLFGNYIDPEIYVAPKLNPFIMDLVDTQVAPGTESIWYVERINEEGNAAFIGEGDLKPLIDGEYKERKADVKEVAERWKMSKRLINHAPSVVSDFRTHADELIRLKMDTGVLSGDGTGDELEGITELASPFIVPTQLANYYESANIFDVIIAIATYVRLNNFKGNLTCVLNTVWQAKMFGVKNLEGDYIIPPFVTKDGKQVGEVRVQFENGLDQDSILLGDLKKFKVRIAEDLKYYEGWENDDFSKNLESRKIEAFLGTYLPTNHAGAIIYDDIATVLTAISAT